MEVSCLPLDLQVYNPTGQLVYQREVIRTTGKGRGWRVARITICSEIPAACPGKAGWRFFGKICNLSQCRVLPAGL
ncbi:hypothetical protein [Pontibacter chitinilyticus]|uniref:hypothetical protein n=1 Tax=Pontibacter chitinilyticus TaxID=2674989 RepID=UPI003D27D563